MAHRTRGIRARDLSRGARDVASQLRCAAAPATLALDRPVARGLVSCDGTARPPGDVLGVVCVRLLVSGTLAR
jgi:hypothetical protein